MTYADISHVLIKVMEISIIVLAKNEARNIRQCLDGIFRQKIKYPYEVILIDSGSRDNTLEIARGYNIRIHEIPAHEFGHGKTRNLGAGLAKGKFLVFLTADAVPGDENWLWNLIEGIRDRKDVAASYSRQIPKQGTSPMERWDILKVNPDKREIKKLAPPVSRKQMRCLISFQDISSCIKKDVWEKIRFDEDIIMSEDQDWAKRVLQAGFGIIYEPSSTVFHSHNYRPKEIFKRSFDEAWSLSQVLGVGIFPNPFKEFITFLYHMGHDFYSILTENDKKLQWFVEAPAFRFMRRMGLFLGSYYPYVPFRLKRIFSYYMGKQRE